MSVVEDFMALISGWTINGQTGAPAIISYSFPTAVPDYLRDYYSEEELATFRRFDDDAKDAARRMIEKLAEITGIVFLEVEREYGDIKFMGFDMDVMNPGAGGFAYYPSNGSTSLIASDIFIHYEWTDFEPLLMHELLHAIGLKHPHDGEVTLEPSLDTTLQTIMSYESGDGYADDIFGPLDFQALQYLYGDTANVANIPIPWSWDENSRTLYQTGSESADEIVGIGGSDFIYADAGDDVIFTREGNDTVDAGAGNDEIYFGPGDGLVLGGDGDDFVYFVKNRSDHLTFDGGAGFDEAYLVFSPDNPDGIDLNFLHYGGVFVSSVEAITLFGGDLGSGFVDSLQFDYVAILGGSGDDDVRAPGYNTAFNGEYIAHPTRYYSGGAGNDIFYLGEHAAIVYGDEGADEYFFYYAEDLSAPSVHILADFETGIDTLNLEHFHVWNLAFPEGDDGLLTGLTAWGAFSIEIGGTIALEDLVLKQGTGEYIAGTADTETIMGTELADYLAGMAGDDVLIGGAREDVLDGGEGSDRLYGGLWSDTYIVDRMDDLTFEELNQGIDTVISSSNYYLYANVEQLVLAIGAGDIFGVGNELANQLIGNEGQNLLLGGAGNDLVYGGGARDAIFGEAGDDRIYGESGIDYLVGGDGRDRIYGGDDPDEIYGMDGDDLLYGGNSFDTDILVGGAGNDVLHGDGGLGDYDRMNGGDGDDVYFVDSGDDLTFEAAGGGIDRVVADIAGENSGVYLYPHVENLELRGTTTFGVGNELDNDIVGNDEDNWLLGGDGDDWLQPGSGDNVIFGQGGSDLFTIRPLGGHNIIADYEPGVDKLDLYDIRSVEEFRLYATQYGEDILVVRPSLSVILLGVQINDITDIDFLW